MYKQSSLRTMNLFTDRPNILTRHVSKRESMQYDKTHLDVIMSLTNNTKTYRCESQSQRPSDDYCFVLCSLCISTAVRTNKIYLITISAPFLSTLVLSLLINGPCPTKSHTFTCRCSNSTCIFQQYKINMYLFNTSSATTSAFQVSTR